MYYIEKTDKPRLMEKTLKIIKIEENKLFIPINKSDELKEKQSIKLAQKTHKILEKTMSKKIVLSKEILETKTYYIHMDMT